jgi:hypothetical protein
MFSGQFGQSCRKNKVKKKRKKNPDSLEKGLTLVLLMMATHFTRS